jgi:para-nitrobenzyl esterase
MTRYRKLTATLLLLSTTTFAAVAYAAPGGIPGPNPNAPGQQNKANGPTVSTTDGPVQGFVKNGVNTFLGIPYAAPPVGDLRWMPPQPPAHHSKLDATEFANTCPQVTELGAFAGPSSTTEDCLYLNVFTKSTSGSKPVLVWIHGGGNVDGETNDYDGSKLATGGPNGVPTVVVTINYRLGLFGFFSNPAINSEGHPWGNYGILDQQAALRWVRDNIANFGGDPNNVTLGGQSAGARDTTANLMSPSAAGLFHRAILQSYPETSWVTAAQMLVKGTDFGVAAGCPGSGASQCLRNLSAERILQLQGTPNANSQYAQQVFPDGTIVPLQPGDAWSTGQFHHMPIMAGLVHDEGNFGLSISEYFSGPPQVALTPQQYDSNNSQAVKDEYPLSDYGGNPQLAQNRVGTDRIACTTLRVAQLLAPQVPTYAYEFNYQNAPYYFPQMPNAYNTGSPGSGTGLFQPLAAHTIDIQFMFPGYHGGNLGVNLDQTSGQPRELNSSETQLSNQLVAAWTNFAKNGDPNGQGAPVWLVFTNGPGPFLSQNIPSSSSYSAAQFFADHKCDFWYPVLGYPTT